MLTSRASEPKDGTEQQERPQKYDGDGIPFLFRASFPGSFPIVPAAHRSAVQCSVAIPRQCETRRNNEKRDIRPSHATCNARRSNETKGPLLSDARLHLLSQYHRRESEGCIFMFSSCVCLSNGDYVIRVADLGKANGVCRTS